MAYVRAVTLRKYKAIHKRYKELYDINRLRHDDVIQQLKEEFFIAEDNTIFRILRADLDELEKLVPQKKPEVST